MKNLQRILLVSALSVSSALWAADPQPLLYPDCPLGMQGGMGMQGGKRMMRMQQMSPEQMETALQQRYQSLEDPAAQQRFLQDLADRAELMTRHARLIQQFVSQHQ
ncbi:hypothetical protein ACKC5O_01930 [Aeromonas schubertii]|uniref:Uncharacterized protein n=1 Tax=Aeromonas schubertii TaxID=652 RepID=A0ABS7V5Y2_9GAMM|nr:hypothetical protein [Aeromonas schubertii]MBZ6064774.1 hypothetical protein [Aeromonas schubertii]